MNRSLRLVLEVLVVALAAWQVFDLGVAFYNRFSANFDLEWMEGATLLTGLRARDGLPFYTPPTADYIPFIYPPLYAWCLGMLGHVFPFGYALGRGLSIASTTIAAGLLAWGARREGARWPLAVGAAALFLGCYEEGGTFYDLVRIDSLALAFTGAALVLGRRESRAAAVASGLMLALAFATKHNMALFGLPIALWRWRTRGWRDAALFVAASAGPALVFTIVMQVQTNGYFLTYLLAVPSHHGIVTDRLLPNLSHGRVEGAQAEMLRALPWTTTVGLLTLPWWIRRAGGAYWGGAALVGLVMTSLMRGHQGGFVNVLIPMFWLLALWPVLVEAAFPPGPGWRAWTPHAFALLMAAQLYEGRTSLVKYLPTAADRKAAADLVDELRDLPEPILMPHGPYYPVLAGKAPSFALITLWDIDHKGGPLAKASRVVDRALATHHWATIVTPDDKLGYGLREHYTRGEPLKAHTFGTRTGWGVRFRQVWHPDAGPAEGGEPATTEEGGGPPDDRDAADREGAPTDDETP